MKSFLLLDERLKSCLLLMIGYSVSPTRSVFPDYGLLTDFPPKKDWEKSVFPLKVCFSLKSVKNLFFPLKNHSF